MAKYILICFLMSSTLMGCEVNTEAEKAFKKGISHERNERIELAIQEYNKAINLDSKYIKRFLQRGIKSKNISYIGGMISDYTDILNLRSQSIIGFDQEDYDQYYSNPDEAIQDLTILITENDSNAYLYFKRGVAQFEKGAFAESLKDLETVSKMNSTYAEAYYMLSVVNYAMGNIKGVIENSNLAIVNNLFHSQAYYVNGMANKSSGNYQQAVESFTKAIEADRDFAAAYYQRAQVQYILVYKKMNADINSAISDYSLAIRIDPSSEKYFFGRGAANLTYAKNYRNAIDDFSEVLKIRPKYALAYFNRAKAYYENKEFEKSLADINKAELYGFESAKELKQAVSQRISH